jgi:DNA-binding SARP family transcriptional activator
VPRLLVSLLGVPSIQLDGARVKLDRNKALALLAYLSTKNTPQSRDHLAALLWPDSDPRQSRGSLRRALATLTKRLPGTWWEADRASIALRDDVDIWVDVGEFRMLTKDETSVGLPPEERLMRAISLYGGDFLQGVTVRDSPDFEEWQAGQADELRGEALTALERLVVLQHSAGDHAAALSSARRWITMDSFAEPCYRWLMTLYAASGQRSLAMRQYQECQRVLGRELGVAPEESTTLLYRRIGRGEAAEESADALAGSAGDAALDAPGRTRTRGAEAAPSPAPPRLVGREREWPELVAALARARSGARHVVLLRGEPGIGKTVLAEELAEAARESGCTILRASCLPEVQAPYAPVLHLIREALRSRRDVVSGLPQHVLADLLVFAPELRAAFSDVSSNPRLPPRAEQLRLFDSVVSLFARLTSVAPVVCFIDDLHWLDAASAAALRHLVDNSSDQRLLFVFTLRDAEASASPALASWSSELERSAVATVLDVPPFTPQQTRDQVRGILGADGISDAFLQALHAETEGNPFFIAEICRSLRESGDLYHAGGYWRRKDMKSIVLPASVRDAIIARAQRLPEDVQTCLRLAAVLGAEFTYADLRQVDILGDEALVDALEHAERMRFVRSASGEGPAAFTFAHPLIPFALRESMSSARRQRLHHRVATMLEASPRRPHPEVLARHFLAAGDTERGIAHSLDAADRMSTLHAHETAVEHLQRGLGLLGSSITWSGSRRTVLERLGDELVLLGDRADALEAFDEALGVRREERPVDALATLRLHRKIIECHAGIRDRNDSARYQERVRTSLAEGLEMLHGLEHHAEVVLFFTAAAKDAWGARSEQDWEAAGEFARRAVEIAESLGSPEVLSRALGALGVVLGAQQRLREQAEVASRRVTLTRSANFHDTMEHLQVLCEAGQAFLRVGEFAASLSLLLEAERRAAKMRAIDAHLYAVSLQAECLFSLDRWQEMLEIEEKRQALVREYTSRRIGRFCFYCGLEANVLALRGRVDEATRSREVAHAMMSASMGPMESWPRAGLYCRGKALVGLGDYDVVRTELERALHASATWVGDHDLYAMLVDVAVRQRHEEDLRTYAPLAEETARAVGHGLYIAIAERARGVLHVLTGDFVAADARLREALRSFREIGAAWQVARTLSELGELALARDDREDAARLFEDAVGRFDELGAIPDASTTRALMTRVA